jgi:REP element-mobilizing transposase RayT
MGRSRYVITEPDRPHFLTCTIVQWLPVFTRPEAVAIVLNSWEYLRQNDQFQLHGYVILENHLHFIAQAPHLDRCIARFKSFTARQTINLLERHNAQILLQQLAFAKTAHKGDREYQLWQEGSHAELILSDDMMCEKLDYIHNNPVKRGYVDDPAAWRYSSARNYLERSGLIAIDPW